MKFEFAIKPHEYEPGIVFEDAACHGVYIEVGSDDTYDWFRKQGLEGNGYTVLGLVDSLCRLKLQEDTGKYLMEAEADNTWVYGREKEPIDRLVDEFREMTADEAGVKRLIENASSGMLD
ncbi:MAG: immunity 51 family protein [Anaerolineales bacterium]|nr:immunity 51 family protein [Anaerolineales bacterium]